MERLRDKDFHFAIPASIFDVPDLSVHEQMVWMVIKAHTGIENQAWPGIKKIAACARMSERQVRYAIYGDPRKQTAGLIEKGLLALTSRFEGTKHGTIRQTSNLYEPVNPQLILSNTVPNAGISEQVTAKSGQAPAQSAAGGVHNVQGVGAQCAVPPLHDVQAKNLDHLEHDHLNSVCTDEQLATLLIQKTGEDTDPASLVKQITAMVKKYGREKVQAKIEVIAQLDIHTTAIGALKAALRDDWQPVVKRERKKPATVSTSRSAAAAADERYANFFKQYPGVTNK